MVQSIFIRLTVEEEGYRNCRVACDVIAAMLVDRNNKVFLPLELTSIFMQNLMWANPPILRHSSSRGLGTPEVKIASVPVGQNSLKLLEIGTC